MAVLGEITHHHSRGEGCYLRHHRAICLPRRGATARLLGWSVKTSVLEGTLDQRCLSKYWNVIRIQRAGHELKFTISGSCNPFRHKGGLMPSPGKLEPNEVPVAYTPT